LGFVLLRENYALKTFTNAQDNKLATTVWKDSSKRDAAGAPLVPL
jgi:hypothetical protein